MNNQPNFLDRVGHARKDGIVIAFDESEALIRYDDGSEDWVRFEKIRLLRTAKDWAYMGDGTPIPYVKGLIGK